MSKPYQPPFQLSHAILASVANIAELIGRWRQAGGDELVPQLRRGNRVLTIQASLAIEQNTLTVEQVTAVLDGKPVLGPPREIQEVKNAFAAYEAMTGWQPTRHADLMAAHRLLLQGLTDDAGSLRQAGVGVFQGKQLVHMAPPAAQVPRLTSQLLRWLAHTDAHPLVASSAVHYELEFIHPFSDGNGRIGRLWQTLILSRWQPMLAYLPVETIIRSRQDDYYRVLGEADAAADCSGFIQFMLDAIATSLHQALEVEATMARAPGMASPETPVKTLVKTPVKTADQILDLLRRHPTLTLAKVAIHLGKSSSAVERAARKLREAGRLQYVGPQKGGHWEVVP